MEKTVKQLKEEYDTLATEIRLVVFPSIKKKREQIKMGKFRLEQIASEWGVNTSRVTNFTPEILFQLDEYLDEEIRIHTKMNEVNIHDCQ